MIDLIKTLVETLAQILPRIGSVRSDKRRRELGVTLFMLYVRLNETMLTAESIVDSLETYTVTMQRHTEDGDYPYALRAGRWIADKITSQVVNLERLGGLLASQAAVLQIIDADAYNKLVPLLETKFGALAQLLSIMRRGALPLDLTPGPHGSWNSTTLRTSITWGDEIYDQVVSYLTERAPREQIAGIRAALAAMREALERHFSISDVLLEVGDRSVTDDDRYR
ncbi:MAG TPA: hypothetical protein VFQ44_29595 [Streptosporangiaceae bacterium]|nr:hypothetical protein [Streptosporangiaceae bacterium]